MLAPDPSEDLKTGRRVLETMPGVRIFEDLVWDKRYGEWRIGLEVSGRIEKNPWIGNPTRVYLLISDRYPLGSVRVYAAKRGGFEATFRHQLFNGDDTGDAPYRSGEICVASEFRPLRRSDFSQEPSSAIGRLEWTVRRIVLWLEKASADALVSDGEPYEMPQFPRTRAGEGYVAFFEDRATFSLWGNSEARVGTVEFLVPKAPPILMASAFRTLANELVARSSLGTWAEQTEATVKGIWIRLDEAPVLPPYQAPVTWAELKSVAADQGVDLSDCLRKALPSVRGDPEPVILLIGFPIPQYVGGVRYMLQWQPITLNGLSRSAPKKQPRERTAYHWFMDQQTWYADDKKISWSGSENWSSEQTTVRLSSGGFQDANALFIGAGALGSVVSDLMARSGLRNGTIFDPETLEIGNLVRHELTIESVKRTKATSVVDHLNTVNPHGRFVAAAGRFDPHSEKCVTAAECADIIIDCSGSDETAAALSDLNLSATKLFASLSVTPNVRFLLFFVSSGATFPTDVFWDKSAPVLRKDEVIGALGDLPRETGCWDVRMPGNPEDVAMMSGIIVRLVREYLISPPETPVMRVFETTVDDSGFRGVHEVQLD